MKLLAKALMKSKSYKERQKQLREAIDHLSFNYSEVFTLLYREMKRRENESNRPRNISFWLDSSNCYVKLHEALILVKNNNFMVKDEYLDCLKHMLNQTIENGTNIDKAVKICRLIEKSTHLKSIHDHLKYLIQRIYQLNKNKHYNHTKFRPNNLRQNNFQKIQDSLVPLNMECKQPRHISMLQPSNSKLPFDLSHLELHCNNYDCREIFTTANNCLNFDIPQPKTYLNLTIVDQDMDGAFAKWLRYLKLHKYQWFFNTLSYREIECIDEDNIEELIVKVNKNTITKGAKNKICVSTKILRDRKQKLNDLLISLDMEVTPYELCEIAAYMRDILHYPIPNKNCVVGDQLQQGIICIMEKLNNQLLEKLNVTWTLHPESLLGNSINKFLECTMVITGNEMFMKQHKNKMSSFAKELKYKVNQMPKIRRSFFQPNFN